MKRLILAAAIISLAALVNAQSPTPSPEQAGAWIEQTNWKQRSQDPQKAEKWADIVIKKNAKTPEEKARKRAAQEAKAIALRHQKKLADAAAYLEGLDYEAIRAESKSRFASLKSLQCRNLIEMNLVAEARAIVDEAKSLEPESGVLTFTEVQVFEAEGKDAEARETAVSFLDRNTAELGGVQKVKQYLEPAALSDGQKKRLVSALKAMRYRYSTKETVDVRAIDALDILISNYE